MNAPSLRRCAVVCWTVATMASFAGNASGQPNDETVREASQHFRRGVELYGEADYASALVEFRRANALAPSVSALYNVGESQYQLQDYAGALKTFQRYLAEAGPNESHRAEVEGNIQVLRTRVGHVIVKTDPAGADVAVDDQTVGKTPLGEPLLVSIGRRKVAASMAGRLPVVQYVEVAAGDEARVNLALAPAMVAPPSAPREPRLAVPPVTERPSEGPDLRLPGWIATGVLAAGAATFGALAIAEDNELKSARSGLTTSATLSHDSNLTATYSALADGLTVAAIVVGGLSLYWTLSWRAPETHDETPKTRRVVVGPTGARFEATF